MAPEQKHSENGKRTAIYHSLLSIFTFTVIIRAARNKDKLIDHRSKLVEIYSPTEKEIITTLETINQKKVHSV